MNNLNFKEQLVLVVTAGVLGQGIDSETPNEVATTVSRIVDAIMQDMADVTDKPRERATMETTAYPSKGGTVLSSETNPSCPNCGSRMAKRKGKNGPFWGCTKYSIDGCRGSFSIVDDGDPGDRPDDDEVPW